MAKFVDMRLRFRISVFAVIMLSIAPLKAQNLPISALASYATYRAALLRQGWIPDFNYGIKNDNGTPMYKYPEIICGNSLCSAQWIARNHKKVSIVLWIDVTGNYHVAPQIEWIE